MRGRARDSRPRSACHATRARDEMGRRLDSGRGGDDRALALAHWNGHVCARWTPRRAQRTPTRAHGACRGERARRAGPTERARHARRAAQTGRMPRLCSLSASCRLTAQRRAAGGGSPKWPGCFPLIEPNFLLWWLWRWPIKHKPARVVPVASARPDQNARAVGINIFFF